MWNVTRMALYTTANVYINNALMSISWAGFTVRKHELTGTQKQNSTTKQSENSCPVVFVENSFQQKVQSTKSVKHGWSSKWCWKIGRSNRPEQWRRGRIRSTIDYETYGVGNIFLDWIETLMMIIVWLCSLPFLFWHSASLGTKWRSCRPTAISPSIRWCSCPERNWREWKERFFV